MKRILLAALAAASLLGSTAQAATYGLTTTTAQEAAITDARTRFNNAQPTVCDAQGQNCTQPTAKATNAAFMLAVLTNAITSWNTQPTNLSMDVPTKNSAITLLQADVARGDANSALAQTLLTQLQNAQ